MKKETYMPILGAVIVIGFFIVMAFLLSNAKYESTINLAIGALLGAFGTVVNYFFGSSKGSADKTELLKDK
jgi:hypothetical protein